MPKRLKSAVLQCVGYGSVAVSVYLSLTWNRWQWAVGGMIVMMFLAVVDGATGTGKSEPAKSRILMIIGFGLLATTLLTWLITGQWWWTIAGLVAFVGTVILDAVTDNPASVEVPNTAQERYR